LRASDSADIHSVIGDVANGLSGGSAGQAMEGFSKKCANYQKLSDDFQTLTNAYLVTDRVQFTDEEVTSAQATVKLHWEMSVTTKGAEYTTNRNADLIIKLVREGKHWRIIELTPIDIFDPQNLGG